MCDCEAPGHRLALDHAQLLESAVVKLRDKVERGALLLHLLPAKFTLTDVQRACVAILGRELDKGALRRKLAAQDRPELEAVPGEFLRGPQRPAQLYRASANFEFWRWRTEDSNLPTPATNRQSFPRLPGSERKYHSRMEGPLIESSAH